MAFQKIIFKNSARNTLRTYKGQRYFIGPCFGLEILKSSKARVKQMAFYTTFLAQIKINQKRKFLIECLQFFSPHIQKLEMCFAFMVYSDFGYVSFFPLSKEQ